MYVKRNYSYEKLYSSFCMQDETQIKSSCWRLQQQWMAKPQVFMEEGMELSHQRSLSANPYLSWIELWWKTAQRSTKYSSSHLFFGGSHDLQRRILPENVSNEFWISYAGPWWEAGTREHSEKQGQSREETVGTRCCLGPVTYAQPDSCTGWWKWGYWSGCREAAWMNLCPSENLFR